MLKQILILSSCLLLSACTAEKACTLIGCNDGLNIGFKGSLPQNFTLTLKASDQPDLTLSCPSGSARHVCFPDSVFVNNYTPESLEISYTAGETSFTRSFTPSYRNAQPNGPGCGPDCRQGKVELEL